MRIVPLACAVLLAACTEATRAPASGSEPERVVQALYDAMNRKDVEGALALYAPDAVFVELPADTVARGTSQLRLHYKEQFTLLPGVRVEVRGRTVDGGTVVDEVLVRGHPCGGTVTDVITYNVAAGRIRSASVEPRAEEEVKVVSIVPGVHVACPVRPAS
jgi:hypothetical protein